jgi:hypothetical protein
VSFNIGICHFCSGIMSLKEVREGVVWEERTSHNWIWFDDEDTIRVAHKRCWKRLEEGERKHIRKKSYRAPKILGQWA